MASEACCTIPPVVGSADYATKGSYTTLLDENMRTYVTGPAEAKTGVLVVYDIFGLDFPQTLQGCDLVAAGTRARVVVPDLFRGKPMDIAGFPPDSPEKRQALKAFFAGPAAPPATAAFVRDTLAPALQEAFPIVERWAIVGYCWGGKIATLLSAAAGEAQPFFVAGAQLHPAMLDAADAAQLAVPHFCLATAGEDADTTQRFKEALEANGKARDKSVVLRWEGTFHGFMAARANLQDRDNLEYYEKGFVPFLACEGEREDKKAGWRWLIGWWLSGTRNSSTGSTKFCKLDLLAGCHVASVSMGGGVR